MSSNKHGRSKDERYAMPPQVEWCTDSESGERVPSRIVVFDPAWEPDRRTRHTVNRCRYDLLEVSPALPWWRRRRHYLAVGAVLLAVLAVFRLLIDEPPIVSLLVAGVVSVASMAWFVWGLEVWSPRRHRALVEARRHVLVVPGDDPVASVYDQAVCAEALALWRTSAERDAWARCSDERLWQVARRRRAAVDARRAHDALTAEAVLAQQDAPAGLVLGCEATADVERRLAALQAEVADHDAAAAGLVEEWRASLGALDALRAAKVTAAADHLRSRVASVSGEVTAGSVLAVGEDMTARAANDLVFAAVGHQRAWEELAGQDPAGELTTAVCPPADQTTRGPAREQAVEADGHAP